MLRYLLHVLRVSADFRNLFLKCLHVRTFSPYWNLMLQNLLVRKPCGRLDLFRCGLSRLFLHLLVALYGRELCDKLDFWTFSGHPLAKIRGHVLHWVESSRRMWLCLVSKVLSGHDQTRGFGPLWPPSAQWSLIRRLVSYVLKVKCAFLNLHLIEII